MGRQSTSVGRKASQNEENVDVTGTLEAINVKLKALEEFNK